MIRYLCLKLLLLDREGAVLNFSLSQIKKYVETNHLRFPVVVLDNEGGLEVVMDNSELGACAGDPRQFVTKLREKGALSMSD